MDTDFLVMQPLTPWLDHLKDNAIVRQQLSVC